MKPWLIVLLALLATACAELMDDIGDVTDTTRTVRHAITDVPDDEEREIGESVAEQLLGAAPPVDDDAVQRYVNLVGTWVASHSDRPNLDWTFAVVEADTVNAFATPGGYIFVSRGLFLLLEDEAELAAVLGHEIAHVTERHHMQELRRRAQRSLAFNLVEQAAGEGLDDEGLRMLADASVELYDRGLDRGDELDADRLGVTFAARAGYDPWALLSTLTTLAAIHPEALAIEQLSATHPPANDRREQLEIWLDETGLESGLRPTTRFRAIRDRLAVDEQSP